MAAGQESDSICVCGLCWMESVCDVDQCAFFASVLMSWCVKTVAGDIADVQGS